MRKRSEALAARSKAAREVVEKPDTEDEDIERAAIMEEGAPSLVRPHVPDLPHKRYSFASVNTAKPEALRGDLDQIVETVWLDNMHETWLRVKQSLAVGAKRSEHGILHKALDEARSLSYDAHRLYITAKREHDRWELANAPVFATMWNKAVHELQAEKDAKARSKAITDTDVESKIQAMYPDEYAAQENRRKAVKLTVDNMMQLSKEANEHVEDLRVMLSKLRSSG